jgi:DNA repair exonuclease SbcCD ATPase subunit
MADINMNDAPEAKKEVEAAEERLKTLEHSEQHYFKRFARASQARPPFGGTVC